MVVYVVHPGYVRSKDGDNHYISYYRLVELYGVDTHNCIRYNGYSTRLESLRARGYKVVNLYPKSNGNYTINMERL